MADKRVIGRALAALIASTVAIAAPILTEPNEGYRGDVYRDPAGIPTQCYGETVHINRGIVYTQAECAAKLRERMARDYAAPLVKCVPEFANPERRNAFGASSDFAYNAGAAAFCRSPMARKFNAGDWSGGCMAFVGYYVTAKGKRLNGLVRRRQEEARFCLTGKVR